MNTDTARDFLAFLDPDATEFTFQTKPDPKNLNTPSNVYHGSFDDLKNQLDTLNRHKSFIGVAVNETDLTGRKNENITRIRAVWHEDDDGYQGGFPLDPSLIVETSPDRFHRYWIIDPAYDGMSIPEFSRVQSVLIDDYGSDTAAKALSQALRLPGSRNWKHEIKDGHLVSFVGGTWKRYPAEHILSALGVLRDGEQPATDIVPEHKAPVATTGELNRVKAALEHLSADDYQTWLTYGMALYDASEGSAKGFDVWDGWSQTTTARNYHLDVNERYWKKEFPKREGRGERVTLATIFHDAFEAGYQEFAEVPDEPKIDGPDVSPFKGTSFDGDAFADTVIASVREKFSEWEHRPTDDDWEGLSDITKAYHRMAGNALGPAYFLSSLPPGMGKTTVITESTKALLKWPDYEDAAVIYFMSRIEEINTLVKHMGLSKDDFGVLVSDSRKADVTSLGNPDTNKARVLFTTQQMLERRSIGKDFEEIEEFFYNGRPRGVRIWDETIAPSRSITLTNFGIGRLFDGLKSGGHWKLASELFDWAYMLKASKTGDIVEVPDVSVAIGSIAEFREMFSDTRDKDKAEALFTMSGRSVRVRRDNLDGTTALEYQDILPEDIKPMLILDASGGQRETYRFWENNRGGLYRLKSPGKRYSNLTIHHLDRGSGKSLYKKDARKVAEIADAVSRTINIDLPSADPVLIIHPLRENKNSPDVERWIRDGLNPNRTGEVHFLNWGRHTATNEYAHVKHVFLISILQYNEAQYEAIGRGAKKATFEEPFPETDYERIRFGEIAHNILQAACRGTVRRSFDGDCPPGCNLYVIFPTNKKGFSRDGLNRVFPDARIADWLPFAERQEITLKGNALKVFEAVKEALGHGKSVEASAVMKLSGIAAAGNFSNLVKRADVMKALGGLGVEYRKGVGSSPPVFQKTTERFDPFTLARVNSVAF